MNFCNWALSLQFTFQHSVCIQSMPPTVMHVQIHELCLALTWNRQAQTYWGTYKCPKHKIYFSK